MNSELNDVGKDSILDEPFLNVTIIARRNDSSLMNNNNVSTIQEQQQQQLNLIGYLLMSTFLVILSIILALLVYSILRRRHLLFDSIAYYAERTAGAQQQSRSMLLRIQRRYETIEHWIITKQVQAHDDFCDKVVSNFGHHTVTATKAGDGNDPTTTKTTDAASPSSCVPCQQQPQVAASDTAAESDQRECPICMSPLTKGQIVSWSANEACSHVYHHQCIKEWLLRHVDCCLCKNIFLPVDEKKGRAKEAALQELSCQYAAASATSYYCAKTGLVRIPRSVRCTKAELTQLERRIFEGTVAPNKLASIRGSREASTSRNDDLLPIVAGGASGVGNNSHLGLSSTFTNTTDTDVDDEEEREMPSPEGSSSSCSDHDSPDEECVSTQQSQSHQAISQSPRDVELGDQELFTATYHLEMETSRLGDNRCCIDDSDGSVEVKETSSSGHIREEEELSSHSTMDNHSWREGN